MKSNFKNDIIFGRIDGIPEFGFSNVLQITSGNAISRHLLFKRGFFLKIKISITFLLEKQFEQTTSFSKELMQLYNLASGMVYKLSRQRQLSTQLFFTRLFFLEIEISITFLYEKQF